MAKGLLHEAMDLEPIGPPSIARSRLGHPDHEAFSQPTSFAGCPVLLVNDAAIVVLALLDDALVVASPSEEGLASFASEGSKMESSRWFIANPAQLVLHWVQSIQLQIRKDEGGISFLYRFKSGYVNVGGISDRFGDVAFHEIISSQFHVHFHVKQSLTESSVDDQDSFNSALLYAKTCNKMGAEIKQHFALDILHFALEVVPVGGASKFLLQCFTFGGDRK